MLPFLFVDHALYEGAPKVPAAIVLPVTVDGIDCYAQLDTGAPKAVIWHQRGAEGAPRKTVTVELAGQRRSVDADAANLAMLEAGRCRQDLIATIGNEFFEQGTLTLDLAGARYQWQQGAGLQAAADAQPMQYVRWGGPGGHPLVTVRVAGGPPQPALLDTGSAAFGINAHDAQAWDGLTGAAPRDGSTLREVQRFSANSWGKQLPCVMGTVPRSLQIGENLALPSFRVAYCEGLGFKPDAPLAGVVGLHHLLGKVLVLDYVSQRWAVRTPQP